MGQTEKGYTVTTWMGWVGEYMTDQGTDQGSDPKRVTDVGVYLSVVYPDPNGVVTLTQMVETLEGYNQDAPEVEDLPYTGAPTVTALIGYLGMRYENALEGDAL